MNSVNMNKTFFLKKEARTPEWHVIDAEGQVLGRMATKIADQLRGKDRPGYTPQTDSGDYIVVINCEKVVLTGNKLEDKVYKRYSGYKSGLTEVTAKEMLATHPDRVVMHAVKGMLPKNILSRQLIKKLKVYAGNVHPHTAQIKNNAD